MGQLARSAYDVILPLDIAFNLMVMDDLDMGLFSSLFGRKEPAPPVAVEMPAQDVQIVEPAAPAVPEAPAPLADPPAPAEERPRRKAYVPPPDTPENRRRAAYYDRERELAKAQGKTVKQLRSGFLSYQDTKDALLELLKDDGVAGLHTVSSSQGMTLALPDGRVIDCRNATLRKFQIHCGRIAGTYYYPAGELPRKDGMKLGMRRDPENEYDSNAVVLTRGKEKAMVGHLAKGTAKFVARELDAGNVLVAHAVLKGRFVLITAPEVWSSLKR
ncbi:HIRAN domain-containing protein [Glutamicibacter mysorens]